MPEVCPICCIELELKSCTILDCDHVFCDDCIRIYVINKINDGEKSIACPYDNCGLDVDDERIQFILKNDDDILIKYIDLCDIDRGKAYSKCVKCGRINSKKTESNMIYCKSCHQTYCFICHEIHSDYLSCPNEDAIKESIREIMSVSGNENLKQCPVCGILIDKEEGCASLKCKYCKTKFCWHCLQTDSRIWKIDSHICPNYNSDSDSEMDYHELNW